MKDFGIRFLFLIFSLDSAAQKMELKGSYQGMNVYIQNPYASDGKSFCTKQVLVNGKTYAFKNESAYIIQLDSMGFQPGDTVKIEIFHETDCRPKVIQHNETLKTLFKFDSVAVSKDGKFYWRTKDESGKIGYIVEQFRWNKWIKVGEADPKAAGSNEYACIVPLHSGTNQFRVKQRYVLGKYQVSKSVSVDNPEPKVEFKPQHLTMNGGSIDFSRETMYEIYDQYGNVVERGTGIKVDCKKLPRGSYYINYDNETSEFNKY